MSANEIHYGDIGTEFRITIKDDTTVVDLSTASELYLIFKKPGTSGTVTKTASLHTDGTDGIITYTTVEGDMDEVGTWKVQAKIVMNGTWYSDIKSFKCHRNL